MEVFAGNFGLSNPKIIRTGDPDSSALYLRDSSPDPSARMPPVGSVLIDEEYMKILRQWILQIENAEKPEQALPSVLWNSGTGHITTQEKPPDRII